MAETRSTASTTSNSSAPVPTLVVYRPKAGKAAELQALVEKHGLALRGTGLITTDPVRVWRAIDKRSGDVSFVEMFSWNSEDASRVAHQTPEVMAVWEPMGLVLEELKLSKLEPIATADGAGA